MESLGISKLDLKRRNRKQILHIMREFGPISRVDIAAQLDLTRAAVTIITNDMIEQGVLKELGEAPIDEKNPKKGRRKILIDINKNSKFVLGAMINEHSISVGLSNIAGDMLDKELMPLTDEVDQQDIISFIAKTSQKMIKKAGLTDKQVLGMGVGIVPERWEQLRAEMRGELPDFSKLRYILELELNVPVVCGNAIALYATASLDYRKGSQNQMLLYSGPHYNLVNISQNTLLRNCLVNSTMVERIIINPEGRKAEGYPDGSVYAELTTTAIVEGIRDAFSAKKTPVLYKLCDGNADAITISKMDEAYAQGDAAVVEWMDTRIELLAQLLYNMMLTQYADTAVLQNYYFCDAQIKKLYACLAEIGGEDMTKRVVISTIDEERSFLAGCMYATEVMFYSQGGLKYETR